MSYISKGLKELGFLGVLVASALAINYYSRPPPLKQPYVFGLGTYRADGKECTVWSSRDTRDATQTIICNTSENGERVGRHGL